MSCFLSNTRATLEQIFPLRKYIKIKLMILVSHTFGYFWYKLTNFYYHLGVYFRYFIILCSITQQTNFFLKMSSYLFTKWEEFCSYLAHILLIILQYEFLQSYCQLICLKWSDIRALIP